MALLGFVVRRTLVAAVIVFVLTAITFVIYVQLPANPGRILYPGRQFVSDEELAKANHALGTDRPLPVQYAKFVGRLAHGDFGMSWNGSRLDATTGQLAGLPVRTAVLDSLRVTGSLALGGAVLLLLLAVPFGLLAASRAGGIFDRLAITLSLVAISTHPIVVGLLLRIGFADRIHLAPARGYCDFFDSPPVLTEAERLSGSIHFCGGPGDWLSHLILPWITFALFLVAIYLRMVRSRMVEVLGEPYMSTARAKGASEWRALTRHGLRNAISPVITMLGMDIGMALGLAIYVEAVFGLPGLGNLTLFALSGSAGYDRPMILGVVVVTAVAIVTLNLIADIVVALLDPRVRSAGIRRVSLHGTTAA